MVKFLVVIDLATVYRLPPMVRCPMVGATISFPPRLARWEEVSTIAVRRATSFHRSEALPGLLGRRMSHAPVPILRPTLQRSTLAAVLDQSAAARRSARRQRREDMRRVWASMLGPQPAAG